MEIYKKKDSRKEIIQSVYIWNYSEKEDRTTA